MIKKSNVDSIMFVKTGYIWAQQDKILGPHSCLVHHLTSICLNITYITVIYKATTTSMFEYYPL